jgi:hypothetical protein
MKTGASVRLDVPEANRLIDLNGIKWDLTFVIKWCDVYLAHFKRLFKEAQGDDDAFRAFAIAIPTVYARCFASGVRRRLDAPLAKLLTAEETCCHEEFINLRDKHIAHSVNNFELGYIEVNLNPPERGKQINLVTVGTQTIMALKADSYEMLKMVAGKLLQWLDDEILTEEIRVKKIIGERYTLEELYILKENQPPLDVVGKVDKQRKRQ